MDTLGCKLNQAETEELSWQLAGVGWQISPDVESADVCILNTCTVTSVADAKSRQRIRAIHHANPRAAIVVTGCYAERDSGRLAELPGVRLVVPNKDKPALVSLVNQIVPEDGLTECVPAQAMFPHRTRSFIKVQEGCDGACAYCIVPSVRGRQNSVAPDIILEQIRQRERLGFKEVVLTGTRVGAYHCGDVNLTGLISRILEGSSVPRIRLSSLQPREISDELLALWSNRRLMPHFHLSVQSACDATLRQMRRRYSLVEFKDTLEMVRRTVRDVAITTDVIVGFPGETEAMFEESLLNCAEMQFARIHVFRFSPRPGTAASMLPGAVSDAAKQARTRRMLRVAAEAAQAFRAKFRGSERPVLFEARDSSGYWYGLTDNYIPVSLRSERDLSNQVVLARVD